MKIAYVKWRDAGEIGGTNVTAEEVDPVTLLESVGIVVSETAGYLVLAMDAHVVGEADTPTFNTPGAIVKSNIIERREIQLKSARRWRKV